MHSVDLITRRLEDIRLDVQSLVDSSRQRLAKSLPKGSILSYRNSSTKPEFEPFELAQALCFCAKYISLPVTAEFRIHELDGNYYLKDRGQLRNLLNEYRSLIQNRKDSTHYLKIHQLCRRKIRNNPAAGLKITIHSHDGEDLTDELLQILSAKISAIDEVLKNCDFRYIYNGILQHSDHEFTERYISDFTSGELNYIFAKHAHVCTYIKHELQLHFDLLQAWNQLSPGPL